MPIPRNMKSSEIKHDDSISHEEKDQYIKQVVNDINFIFDVNDEIYLSNAHNLELCYQLFKNDLVVEDLENQDPIYFTYLVMNSLKNKDEESRKKYIQLGFEHDSPECCNMLANEFDSEGDIDRALELKLKVISYVHKGYEFNNIDYVYLKVGSIYLKKGKYQLAIKYLNKSLKLGMDIALLVLGRTYELMADDEIAIKTYQQCLELKINDEDEDDQYMHDTALYNLTNLLLKLEKYQDYEKYLFEMQRLGTSKALENIAYFYDVREKKGLAKKFLLEALNKSEEEGEYSKSVSDNLKNIYIGLQDYDNAFQLIIRDMEYYPEIGIGDVMKFVEVFCGNESPEKVAHITLLSARSASKDREKFNTAFKDLEDAYPYLKYFREQAEEIVKEIDEKEGKLKKEECCVCCEETYLVKLYCDPKHKLCRQCYSNVRTCPLCREKC